MLRKLVLTLSSALLLAGAALAADVTYVLETPGVT